MRKKKIKKTIIISLSAVLFLFVVLCAHIYIMMKPGKPTATTVALARIDFKQDINNVDANKITTWLYNQQGVQHVLCNDKTDKVVFSFYPARVSANALATDLSSSLNYKAVRYIPSEKDMSKGCPYASSSFAYKVYNFINNII